ncbi:hypothetical protein [uncultured Delftia sp.]|jgi:hypothetical protein|uniref:hypothetical protein n=1 Tax=uncultured Delftia sp. TaxID=191464 RepID=UPI00259ABFB2|nr:hypothetical protein [uncultured Delftia sp.]
MASPELKYTPVAAYKVGEMIFTCFSSWNGMEELRDQKGRKLIVARENAGSFAESFVGLFGVLDIPSKEGSMRVLSGSPDLLMELGLIKKEEK